MTMQEFRERAFQSALAQGCEAAETYYAEQEAFERLRSADMLVAGTV